MKAIILFILLFNACRSYCQLPDDSLKNICLNQFHKDKSIFFKPSSYIGNKFDIKQSFDDYFEKLKIIEIYDLDSQKIPTHNRNYDNLTANINYYFNRDNVFLFYIIDRYSGKIIDVRDYCVFNEIMNAARKKLGNIDKCYLYLLLNHIGGIGIMGDFGYTNGLNVGTPLKTLSYSIFYGSKSSKEIPNRLESKVKSEMLSSTTRDINILIRKNKSDEYTICKYNFIFDENDNLSQIKKDCYE